MSEHEAKEIVDLVIETLVDWDIISQDKYGHMTVDQTQKLAEMVVEKVEE